MSTILAMVITVVVAVIASVAVSGFVFGTFEQAQHPPQILVTGVSLSASYFLAGGTTTTFTCAASSSAATVSLTNAGSGSGTVVGVMITWAGSDNAFTPSGACKIGAAGSSTSTAYVTFPSTSKLSSRGAVDATPGQPFTGTISLSNGAQLLFTGVWQ
jgi:hypothetical protein